LEIGDSLSILPNSAHCSFVVLMAITFSDTGEAWTGSRSPIAAIVFVAL